MIYFVRSNDRLKVGYTTNLDRRLREYKTHNPSAELLGTKEGDTAEERRLHNLLSEWAVADEWFEWNEFTKAIVEAEYEDYAEHFWVCSLGPELIYRTKHVADTKLIYALASKADYNANTLSLSAGERQSICKQIGVSPCNFSKSIARLRELGAIFGEKNDYMINPLMFWKGDLKTREYKLGNPDTQKIFKYKLVEKSGA